MPLKSLRAAKTLGAVTLLAIVTLSACTRGDNGLVAPEGWQEPGWMTQARVEVEEYQAAMLSCYDSFGVYARVALGGGSVLPGFDARGLLPDDAEALQEQVFYAQDYCEGRIPSPQLWSTALDEAAYERMLDTVACIIAHGYKIEDPPSMSVWLEQTDTWNPLQVLYNSTSMTDDSLRDLSLACPHGNSFLWNLM